RCPARTPAVAGSNSGYADARTGSARPRSRSTAARRPPRNPALPDRPSRRQTGAGAGSAAPPSGATCSPAPARRWSGSHAAASTSTSQSTSAGSYQALPRERQALGTPERRLVALPSNAPHVVPVDRLLTAVGGRRGVGHHVARHANQHLRQQF